MCHGDIVHNHAAEKSQRTNSAADLKDKGWAIDVSLWNHRYMSHFIQAYPNIFQVAESAAKLIMTVRDIVQSSLAMYDLTEGPSRDMTFAQSLPIEPHRLFFKHTQWTWAKFPEAERMKKRCLYDFVAA